MTARETLAALRSSIARIEGGAGLRSAPQPRGGGYATAGLHDLYTAESRDAAAVTGFALALIAERCGAEPAAGTVLWIAGAESLAEGARLHGPGLAAFGLDPGRFLFVTVNGPREALWAMEQGLGLAGLGGIVAEFRGAVAGLDLTATRRLALRARAAGNCGLLLRFGAAPLAAATTTRWRVAPAPSPRLEDDARAPGQPAWRLVLEKNRRGPTADFVVEWNRHDRCFHPLAGLKAGAAHSGALSAEPCDRPPRPQAMGTVVAFRA